mmetsp:Transcript_67331/g.161426  ORF Transcript_67331/g.161426 Transcript_67331/m.161426 type:complete len:197 (-) Transcript_67331:242-832(-)
MFGAVVEQLQDGPSVQDVVGLLVVLASSGVASYVANTMVRKAGPAKWRVPAMKEMFVKHAAIWGLPADAFRLCAGGAEVTGGLLMLLGWIPCDICEALCIAGMILLICVMTGASMTQAALGNGWKGMQNSVWFSSWTVLALVLRVAVEVQGILERPAMLAIILGMVAFTTLLGTAVMLRGVYVHRPDPESYTLLDA